MESLRSAVRGDRLVLHNLIVVGGTVLTGLLGFLFQAVISHRLTPADYGAAFAVITLLTLLWLPASAFTLVMARATSRDRATGGQDSPALLRDGNRIILIGGAALAAIMAAGAGWLKDFFGVSTDMILVGAVGLPFSLALPFLFGELQGEQRFVTLSALTTGQAAAKLIGAVLLGALLGPTGVILGISTGTALVYVIAAWCVRERLTSRSTAAWLAPALRFLAIVVPSTLAVAVLFSADVLVVKHVFPVRIAGEYAAVAALGRAVFWGAAGVTLVLFPKAAFRHAEGRSGAMVIAFSLALVTLGGIFGSLVLTLVSRPVLTAFAGVAYAPGGRYLPWYALGMTLFGAASVLITAQQSRGERGFLAILIPVAIIEPVLVATFHSSPFQVVMVLDACVAALLAGLVALSVIAVRRRTIMKTEESSEVMRLVQSG